MYFFFKTFIEDKPKLIFCFHKFILQHAYTCAFEVTRTLKLANNAQKYKGERIKTIVMN